MHGGPLGVEPRRRHDESSWLPSDGNRAARSGQPLSFQIAILFLKGDLVENATTLGFPGATANEHSCPKRWVKSKDLNKFIGLSAVEFPIALKTFEEFKLACTACET